MRISTGSGDCGETGVFSGERLFKDDPRIEALGTLDELGAFLGDARLALAGAKEEKAAAFIKKVQGHLLKVSALISGAEGDIAGLFREIECEENDWEARVNLEDFVLPGEGAAEVNLHISRTVCRRAERRVAALLKAGLCPEGALAYLNRLSDLLFLMAEGIKEH
jgi:cob(I)alamin adenosyltransferase